MYKTRLIHLKLKSGSPTIRDLGLEDTIACLRKTPFIFIMLRTIGEYIDLDYDKRLQLGIGHLLVRSTCETAILVFARPVSLIRDWTQLFLKASLTPFDGPVKRPHPSGVY